MGKHYSRLTVTERERLALMYYRGQGLASTWLTLDNGTENAQHEEITKQIGAKCYFARPYASWQRGANEQTNGMVRWYLPKGTDFRNISEEEVAAVESRINNRPRKCLRYKTPLEVFNRVVALQS